MQQEYPCIAPQLLHDSSSPSPALAAQISSYQAPKEPRNAQPSKYYRRNYDEQTVLTSVNVICRNTKPARYSSAFREPSPSSAIQSQTYNASASYPYGPGQPYIHTSSAAQHATKPQGNKMVQPAEIARQANALGIPQTLPKPPSTTPTQHAGMSSSADIEQSMVAGFLAMTKNYRAMLDDPLSTSAPVQEAPAATPETSSVGAEVDLEQYLQDYTYLMAPPTEVQYHPVASAYEYLGTPQLGDFASPPEDTPANDFLTTPLFDDNDDFLTGPVVDDETPLIAGPSEYMPAQVPSVSTAPAKVPLPETLYTFSPDMPLADSFSTSPYGSHQQSLPSSGQEPAYTGTRRNASSATMIPLDAPTQQRQFRAPSVTARRAEIEDEDEAAKKRRINTVAARKSRKRKAEHMERLTEENERQKRDIRRLEAMNETYRQMLLQNGIAVPHTF